MSYTWSDPSSVDVQAGSHGGASAPRRPLAPIGSYDFTVMEAELKESRKNGLPYINLKLRVGDGEYEDVYSVLAKPDDARPPASNEFLEKSFYAFLDTIRVPRDRASAVWGNVKGLELKNGRTYLKADSYTNPQTGEVREKRQPDWIKGTFEGVNAAADAARAAPLGTSQPDPF